MKREHFLWLLSTTANVSAAPMLISGRENGDLFFSLDSKFRISVFEDLHFGEDEWTDWAPEQDRKTVQVINSILDKEHVDLAVLNGDLVTGENLYLENGTHYIDLMVAPLVNRSIPWASAYGNHDIDINSSSRALMEREKAIGRNLSHTNSMVKGKEAEVGTSNYYLPVYLSGRKSIELLLWFFDSKGGWAYQDRTSEGLKVPTADYVNEEVVKWFSETKKAIRDQEKRVIPSLAFVHIPVYATADFQDAGIDPKKEPGINEEVLGVQGNKCVNKGRDKNGNDEKDCHYAGGDTPFMKELVATEGLLAVFSGHDHRVDWCMKWTATKPLPHTDPSTGNDIHLCLGRHTGYGGYAGEIPRGARQILVRQQNLREKSVETWIRLEDGSVSGHVVLNTTYGQDSYTAEQTSHDGAWDDAKARG
ncbi:calcineurin-like phosphoesterase [Lindgomyces ingoldianus]|uniref:Calcineurin-like phosphoesterase n=1 Tax=Lindgomyces ingoldianus TaxID=673940 RepID=A0ACB6RBL6_9PLEO|nr:calcineurin-like phosphoesterase [Lindgomyces ingoldianus]KAF2476110.1 calcineurin-like phosphoesterase [Lindgomyces ingoldianus]